MPISETALRAVQDCATLFEFLRDRLRWPVDPEDPYTYAGPALNDELAARAEVRQIVPFTTGDPATIFLVEFTTPFRRGDLREILRRIREQIRTQARYSGHKLEELIFVCATEDYRGIRFIRFEAQDGRQPQMSLFGWEIGQTAGTRTLLEYNLPALVMPPLNMVGEPDWMKARWGLAWKLANVPS